MRSSYSALACKSLMPAVTAVALVLCAVPSSHAQCGGYGKLLGHHVAWDSLSAPAALGKPRLLRAGFGDDGDESAHEPSIVGMWHFKFIAMGNAGIPDKTEIDAGYSQWHSDGTEITNSGGRAPSTDDYCLGVWERTGNRKYSLNHFGIGWDPTPTNANPEGVLVGPSSIRENVTLSANGESFSGTFTIVAYDESLNVLAEIKGNIVGTRITPSTNPSSIF